MMKVYTSDDFRGHWPVGTSAVIVANTAERALEILKLELAEKNLPQPLPISVQELDLGEECVLILNDGNY